MYIKGNVDENMALGTLASATLIANSWDESVSEKTTVTSVVLTWSLDQLTSPQGPILFGLAHGDYSDAEIEQVIENTGSWDQGNKIQQEVGRRLVRVVGQFVAASGSTGAQDVDWNDGVPMKTRLNWVLQTGQTLRMWAYNKSGSSLATTDPNFRVNGHINLFQK